MKHLWIIILVIFGIGQIVEHCNALQHNLFYGNCAFDNNTMPIYTQVVSMENLRPPSAEKPRKWYDYILHPFGRRTTPPPQPPSFGHGSTINTTIVYPPLVSHYILKINLFPSLSPYIAIFHRLN